MPFHPRHNLFDLKLVINIVKNQMKDQDLAMVNELNGS